MDQEFLQPCVQEGVAPQKEKKKKKKKKKTHARLIEDDGH